MLGECTLLALRRAPDTVQRCEAVTLDTTLDAGTRWDAWGLWMAAAPGPAAKAAVALPSADLDVPAFRWVVDCLASAVLRGGTGQLPPPGPARQTVGTAATQQLRDDTAALADALLRAAPDALLKAGANAQYRNPRPELAALLALGGRVEQGVGVLRDAPAGQLILAQRAAGYLREAHATSMVTQRFDSLVGELRGQP